MNYLIRKMFEDEYLAVEKISKKTKAELTGRQKEIQELLQPCLAPENMELFREYLDENSKAQRDCEYRAFLRGMKCCAEIFIDIFAD